MVRQMDELVTGDDGGDLYRLDRNQAFLNQGLDEDISKSKEGDEVEELTHGVSLLADESVHITPGFFQVFRGQAKQAACMIYYSRKDAGTPRISPKAGNMVSLCTHTMSYRNTIFASAHAFVSFSCLTFSLWQSSPKTNACRPVGFP